MKVAVYYNLHKHLFSVVSREKENYGKVIAHLPRVILTDVVPKVSEAGRQRVLREQQKNVHAKLFGTLVNDLDMTGVLLREITYNPYKYPSFVYWDDLTEFTGCNMMLLVDKKCYELIGDEV